MSKCASNDASGTITGLDYISSGTFVDEGNDNYHISATDTLVKDIGDDLSADSDLPFSTDIDGETRSAPWDIDADEYIKCSIKIKTEHVQ